MFTLHFPRAVISFSEKFTVTLELLYSGVPDYFSLQIPSLQLRNCTKTEWNCYPCKGLVRMRVKIFSEFVGFVKIDNLQF